MFLAFVATTLADTARTLDGQAVDTREYIVHAWSIEDPSSMETLRRLAGIDGVLAVNTDAASMGAQVRFVARTVDVPVVADPVGRLAGEHDGADVVAEVIRAADESAIAAR